MIKPITDKDLQDITAKIKEQHANWAVMVAAEMSKLAEWKEYSNNPASPENARHLGKGTIKSQDLRRIFVKAVASILLVAKKKSKEVGDLVSQIENM